jgi:hypothetical protein
MGKVSRRPSRAARRSTVRVFRDGDSSVTVQGPVAREPFDVAGMVSVLESLGAHVRAGQDEFVDDDGNVVTVAGPIAGDAVAMAEALGSIVSELRTKFAYTLTQERPLRSNVSLCQVSCPSPLREAA